MTAPVAVSDLVVGARLHSDRKSSGSDAFPTDTEATSIVHRSIARCQGMLVSEGGEDLFALRYSFVTAAGSISYQADYSEPTAVIQTIAVRTVWTATDVEDIDRIEEREEADILTRNDTWGRGSVKAYRFRRGQLELYPPPTGIHRIHHIYIPTYDKTTTIADLRIEGWDEWVMLDAAAQILKLGKELQWSREVKSDRDEVGELMKDRVRARYTQEAIRIVDVAPERRRRFPWWPTGRSNL